MRVSAENRPAPPAGGGQTLMSDVGVPFGFYGSSGSRLERRGRAKPKPGSEVAELGFNPAGLRGAEVPLAAEGAGVGFALALHAREPRCVERIAFRAVTAFARTHALLLFAGGFLHRPELRTQQLNGKTR